MPKVKRSAERKFWKDLCKVFQKLLDRLTSNEKRSIVEEVSNFTMTKEMDQYLGRVVNGMVTMQRVDSAKSWREAASKGSRGQIIYQALKNELNGPVGDRVMELIFENSTYIKTLPKMWAEYASKYAYQEAMKGRRPEEVEKDLRRMMPGHITRNLKCIARTECAKANAAITQARAESMNIKAYWWRSVTDERTRTSHAGMDGVLVFYNDPPNPEALFPVKGQKPYGNYHAGNTFNCRCFQEPVVDMRFMPDIMRVHVNGRIVTMSKAQLIKRFGNVA